MLLGDVVGDDGGEEGGGTSAWSAGTGLTFNSSWAGYFAELYPVLTSPRFDRYINPTKRFPSLKLSPIDSHPDDDDDDLVIEWIDDSISDDEELEAFRDFWRLMEA